MTRMVFATNSKEHNTLQKLEEAREAVRTGDSLQDAVERHITTHGPTSSRASLCRVLQFGPMSYSD